MNLENKHYTKGNKPDKKDNYYMMSFIGNI